VVRFLFQRLTSLNREWVIISFTTILESNTIPKRAVAQSKPEGPQLNPETGTVSGKYRLREEYMPRSTGLAKEDERESITDPFCGIKIM